MKISIITVVLNNENTIGDAIKSVLSQCYDNIEYIIVDGGSTDDTLGIISKYAKNISRFISEPDKGIYDAMNKGINLATGDVVGVLNSDDFYIDNLVIDKVVRAILEKHVDSSYADAIYVRRNDVDKTIRYWKSNPFSKRQFRIGWMPQHATFFARRCLYEKYGAFRTDLPIAADYELMLRFLYKYGISTTYIPEVLVKIRTGGKSAPNPSIVIRNMLENHKAWEVNGLSTSPITVILKPLLKLPQYFKRP
jgi:glycosyltransferase involved in cell wall biosynthesis